MAERGAADHYGAAAGLAEHSYRVPRRADVAIADHRNGNRGRRRADRHPIGVAGEGLLGRRRTVMVAAIELHEAAKARTEISGLDMANQYVIFRCR